MKYSHCPHCGDRYEQDVWPRVCLCCKKIVWRNPLPVVVVEVVINYPFSERKPSELLIVRRANSPCIGEWAFPGGYLEVNETWQEGACREVREETGFIIKPDRLILLNVISSNASNDLLIFSRARITPSEIPADAFVPNSEVSEIKLISEQEPLCFKTHHQMMKEFFRT
jgi:8-oxo-dGTP pyrophosphatase MutT (NUDIX family)